MNMISIFKSGCLRAPWFTDNWAGDGRTMRENLNTNVSMLRANVICIKTPILELETFIYLSFVQQMLEIT